MEAFSPATLGDLGLQDFKKITCEDEKTEIMSLMSLPNVLIYKAFSPLFSPLSYLELTLVKGGVEGRNWGQ
ncbi:hypothetical protein BEST7613_2308 [Synechocystis sp. PCC 6803]|nr:hypothetical protein BEST7613_2308 [Synechocystis sp. PCC 6803] [Bacillus subtilis BEST7613]